MPLLSARGQTRVYDLPNGGQWGTYWEVIVVTNSSGSRTVAIPQFRFYPRDPYTTPVYAIDVDAVI